MTAAHPQPPARPVLELVGTETPAAGWTDPNWSEVGEPLAEAAVLGCLLRTNRQHAASLLGAFHDEDLTVPQHRHVAAAARVLLEQDHPIDPVTVLGQLRRQGTENARTGSRDTGVLLVELCQAAPSVSNTGHYLRIVLEHAYRRRAQQTASRLLQAAETGSLTALHDLVEREHAALTAEHRRTTAPLP
jgi:replicative DNA helicase